MSHSGGLLSRNIEQSRGDNRRIDQHDISSHNDFLSDGGGYFGNHVNDHGGIGGRNDEKLISFLIGFLGSFESLFFMVFPFGKRG